LRIEILPPYVLISVDDGHKTSMRTKNLIEMYGFRATFFLERERWLKTPGFNRAPDIRALCARGFSAATHGTTHPALRFLPKGQCLAELAES
jgi:hypothetical protein